MKKLLQKWKNNESGASMVVVALCVTVFVGFTAFAVDLGNAYNVKVDMQSACDLAALSAASELPNQVNTETKAKEYAEKNGFDKKNVKVKVLDEGKKVQVTISEDVDTYFAGVLGVKSVPISCKAEAMAGERSSGDYAIFSGTKAYFGLHGDITIPAGDIHANGPGDISGTLNIADGVIEVPKFSNQGSSGNYETYVDPDNYVKMPDYTEIINNRLPSTSDVGYTGVDANGYFPNTELYKNYVKDGVLTIEAGKNIKLNSSDVGFDNPGLIKKVVIQGNVIVPCSFAINNGIDLEVTGNLIIRGGARLDTRMYISGSIIANDTISFTNNSNTVFDSANIVSATGEISFEGGSVATDASSVGGYSVFWGQGPNAHININSNMDVKGMFYAPNAQTIMSGGTVKIKGSMVANQIATNNGNFEVELPKNDANWPFGNVNGGNKKKGGAKLVG